MGILDDAIREHLELKRRRGADPSEVDRLEREALGPVRRVTNETPDALSDEPSSHPEDYAVEDDVSGWADSPEIPAWTDSTDEPAPFDPAPNADLEGQPTEHWPAPGAEDRFGDLADPRYSDDPPTSPDHRTDLPRHHEIAEEWEAHERLGEPTGVEPDSPAPSPPPPVSADPAFADELRRPAPPEFDEETAEHEVETDEDPESPRPDAGSAEGDDVLEETPDFLQDTPDHDRLWFEQRPPRDFDFDG